MRTISYERPVLQLFLFALLYSNFLSRLAGLNLNILLYIAMLPAVLCSLKYVKIEAKTELVALMLLWSFVYSFDPRTDYEANLYSFKAFGVPLLGYYIGRMCGRRKKSFLNLLNVLYFPFVAYGLVQAVAFFTGNLLAILPWDVANIHRLEEEGFGNLYRGPFLRFFGPMYSFGEYQLLVVLIAAFLWLNRDAIVRRRLLHINVALAGLFTLISLERSPILIAAILLAFWYIPRTVRNVGRAVKLSALLAAGVFLLVVLDGVLEIEEDELLGTQYSSVKNVVLFRLEADSELLARSEVIWKQAWELAQGSIFGIGAGRLAVFRGSGDKEVKPHNNYLGYHLAYGFLFLLLFLAFMGKSVLDHIRSRSEIGYFGIGLIASCGALAFFSMPFLYRSGIVVFLMLGFIEAQLGASEWTAATAGRRGGATVVSP